MYSIAPTSGPNIGNTTVVRCFSLFIRRLIIYSTVQRVSSARTKADSDMLPIAPTSSPTIGNTLVGCWRVALDVIKNQVEVSVSSQSLMSEKRRSQFNALCRSNAAVRLMSVVSSLPLNKRSLK